LGVVASLNADLDGDGQEETVQSTDDNHTIVLRNGVVLWDHQGWIQGWNRRPWDAFLAADVDHDGHQEIVIWNNTDGWTGVLKWQAGALVLLWASASPLHGPAGQWNRRASDEFTATVYNGQVAVSVVHPEDEWHGVLLWEASALQPVLITQPRPPAPVWTGCNVTRDSIALSWTSPSGNVQYQLEWGAAGYATTGTLVSATNYTVTGLAAGTKYYFSLSYDVIGRGESEVAYTDATTSSGPPPPPVPVPQLIGQSLTQALSTLSHVGLKEGNLVNESIEIRVDYLKVIQQSPLAGRRVPPGSAVDITVTAMPQPIYGFSQAVITNENTDGRTVQVYLIDFANNNPQNMGSLAVNGNQTLTLQDGHNYEIVVVDVGLIDCPGLDPTNVSCQRSLSFANGQKGGPVLQIVVS
jgi:Fibronectin type III domain/PASTA domain